MQGPTFQTQAVASKPQGLASWIVVTDHSRKSWSNAADELRDFFAEHGAAGRAYTFLETWPPGFEKHPQCIAWREGLSYAQYTHLWQRAYDMLRKLMPKLPQKATGLLELDIHTQAAFLLRALASDWFRQNAEGPICLLVSPEMKQLLGIGYSWRSSFWRRARSRLRRRRLAIMGISIVRTARRGTRKWLRRKRLPVLMVRIARAVKRSIFHRVATAYSLSLRARKMLKSRALYRYRVSLVTDRLAQRAGKSGFTLITVEDSGTGVNLEPSLKIIRAFQARREHVVVLSSYRRVASRIKRVTGADSVVYSNPSKSFMPRLVGNRKGLTQTMHAASQDLPVLEAAFVRSFTRKAANLAGELDGIAELLDRLHRAGRIKAVLTINEMLPLSISAGWWATSSGIPWLGFFPILVGDRPDGHHFPAPEHLVYGEQLRDLIVRDGLPTGSVQVVGSPTYDAFLGRDKPADRNAVERQFPACRGKKLLVVATEGFADPLTELGPVLDAVAGMPGVHIVLKLHPEDSLDYFDRYVSALPGNDNISVIKQTDLGALLNAADLMVCIVSNIIISAAVMGTPNLVCDFSGKRTVLDFVREGLCIGCFDPQEVKSAIEGLLFDPNGMRELEAVLERGRRRFNGPNDGRSAERIAGYVLRRAEEAAADSPQPGRSASKRAEPAAAISQPSVAARA